jgi:signal peptidase II
VKGLIKALFKLKYRKLVFIALLVVFFDLVLKWWVHSNFELSESTSIIPNFFNLTYVRNLGAAFGFLAQSHPEFRKLFFAIMPPIACVIIFLIVKKVPDSDKTQIFSLSLIMGGALGNYINRMYFGYVIDFLDFHFFYRYNWPAFNVADMAIVFGVGMLFYLMLRDRNYRNLEIQSR